MERKELYQKGDEIVYYGKKPKSGTFVRYNSHRKDTCFVFFPGNKCKSELFLRDISLLPGI